MRKLRETKLFVLLCLNLCAVLYIALKEKQTGKHLHANLCSDAFPTRASWVLMAHYSMQEARMFS